MKKILRKTVHFVTENKWVFLQMAVFFILPHAICGATVGANIDTGMPWDKGLNTVQSALAGPIPKVASAISIATSGALWMFGQGQIAQVAMRTTLGSGIALSAPTVVTALAGNGTGSGCIFF